MKNCTTYAFLRLPERLKMLFFFLVLLGGNEQAFSQCSNDVTPPAALCKTVTRDILNNGTVVVSAQEFDNGSSDNCTPAGALSYFIELGAPSAAPPSSTSLNFTSSQLGTHTIVLWVVDTAGNAAHCTTTFQLNICVQSLVCNDLITIQLDSANTGLMVPDDGLEGGPYCSFHTFLVRLDPLGGGAPAAPSIILGPQHIGTHMYAVTVLPGGNSCWGNVTIVGDPCVNDQTPPVSVCEGFVSLVLDTALAPTVLLTPPVLNDGSYDNCTPQAGLNFRLRRLADLNGAVPTDTVLHLGLADLGTHPVTLWVGDQAGNWSFCLVDVNLTLPVEHLIEGAVFIDANADCQRQSGSENGLAGWEVRATGANSGQVFVAITDAQGHYRMSVDTNETIFSVALDAPANYGGGCGTTYTVNFSDPALSDTAALEIPVFLDPDCPLLYVDLATPKIRPCFPGVYYVQYANASASAVLGTYVEVTLDAALAFQGSTLPGTALGNQVYRFETGDLDPGESGQFSINFLTDCAAPLGATHCTEAHIFPDTLCPQAVAWSGANIEVEGSCQNDSIFLEIKNTGVGATAQPLDFIVVEDVLMLESGNFTLNPGEVLALNPIAGNGPTFRLQAQQEPGHPYGGLPAVAVEGCGGFTPGMVTLFNLNNPNPFIAIDCRENTNSFDPNDKQALPRGYGAEHLIENTAPLDYTVRFQNTGTDTAYTVVIVDTLSAALAASSVRPGAASHPYHFELLDGHILRFTFDNIGLPDSNVNVAGSQGFVQFNVSQAANNPDGTRIDNAAAIYFDFNAPVITNTTFHTVGSHFIAVSTDAAPANALPLRVYPNPAAERVTFDAPGWSGGAVRFTLTDAQGRVLRDVQARQMPLTLERGQLMAGLYFFRITDSDGRALWSGRVVVR